MRAQDFISEVLIKIAHRVAGKNIQNPLVNGEYFWFKKIIEAQKDESPFMFFDVGANVGNYSMHAMSEMKKRGIKYWIHVFEPAHSTFVELKKNFCNNNHITLNNIGLSDICEELAIYYDTEGSSLASIYKRNISTYGIHIELSEKIKVQRLDSYLFENKIPHIHFMKIDVEGHELRVLRGAGDFLRPDFIRVIQFEYGGCNLDSHTTFCDIYNFLTTAGYSIFQMHPKKITKITVYSPDLDDFQYQNYLAVSNSISL